jgi:hypothetical protein
MGMSRMLAPAMEREYELFERRSNGVLNWRGVVYGLTAARTQTRLLAIETDNECFALRSDDRQIVVLATPDDRAAASA